MVARLVQGPPTPVTCSLSSSSLLLFFCLFCAAQDGTTGLMAASVRGHKDVLELLLKHGANVDQQNLDGHTALMFAYNGRNQVFVIQCSYAINARALYLILRRHRLRNALRDSKWCVICWLMTNASKSSSPVLHRESQ